MGSKVLLADDSITIQKVVGIIFANEDYELTVVDNGNAALEKAREIKPDVVLVDALMPGKTGYEVCQEIRRDPLLKNTPLLLMTGAFEPFDEEKGRQSGADDFISKPFESQNLIDATNRLIALGKERSAAAVEVAAPPVVKAEEPTPAAWEEPTEFAFDEPEPAAFGAAEPAPAVSASPPQPLETPAEDDLWGVFDLEEAKESGVGAVELAETETAEEFAAVTPEEAFGFADEGEEVPPVAEEAEAPPVEAVQAVSADKWVPVDEQEFFFEEEPPREPAEVVVEERKAAPESIPLAEESFAGLEEAGEPSRGIEDVSAAFDAAPSVAEPQFAPEEEFEPAPPLAVSPSPVAASASLDETQLKALLSTISREMLEKIIWEVVPDLAETLIKEEIRKIREGQTGS